MPTTLNKPVYRLTRGHYPALYSQPHRILASLQPGDIVRFQAFFKKRGKVCFDLPIDGAMRHAVALEALKKMAERKAARRRNIFKRGGGK